MMPSLSGLDILDQLKSLNPDIKVILMTAYSNQHKIDESTRLGVDHFFDKPFKSLKDVDQAICSLLKI